MLDLCSAHLSVFELVQGEVEGTQKLAQQNHWIGLRENLNRKPWFLPSNIGLSCKFSLKPIQWNTCKNIMLKMQNIGTMLQHVRKHRKKKKTSGRKNTITKMRSSANKQTCLHKRLNWPCASGTKGKAIHNWNSCYSTLLPIPVPVFAGIARFLSDSRFCPFGFRFNSDLWWFLLGWFHFLRVLFCGRSSNVHLSKIFSHILSVKSNIA